MQWQLPIKGFFREFKSVRIYEPWGKSAPCKIFNILLWLEISKIDHSIVVGWDGGWGGGGEIVSPLVLKSMCPFTSQKCPFIPRITLLFSRITFLFSNIAQQCFFSLMLYLLLALLKAALRCNNSLALVLFPLSTISIYLFTESFFCLLYFGKKNKIPL